MDILAIILILLFVWFVVRPLWRVWSTVNQARRQMREQFGQQQARSRQADEEAPHYAQRRKKIDPDVGEYVDFEDIPTYTHVSYTETTVTYTREEQVSDADWEDLPAK